MKKLYPFFKNIFLFFCVKSQTRYVTQTITSFTVEPRLKRYRFMLSFLAAAFFCSNTVFAQNATVNFNTVGTTTWTCPSGVTTITVQCWGGGGGGGGVATLANSPASGGGAGGSYTSNTVTVVPGTTYSVTVGAGGSGGTNAGTNGSTGGNSSFDVTTIVAVGGPGGTGATTATGAPGGTGTTTGNTAGTNFAGGNGAAGTVSTIGGGGGGAAGNANAGGNAAGSAAGPGGVAGGGNGATGVSNATGGAGTAPGGGGGGTRRTATSRAGGAGGKGSVVVSYINPAPTIEAFSSQTFCASTFTTPTAYNTVSFSLVETAATNFDAGQLNQTLILVLPAGFQFNTAAGTVTRNAIIAQDITIGAVTITTTSVTVNLTTAATQVNIDEINFNNFQIWATANPSSGDLVSTGGTFKVNGSAAIPTPTQSFGHLATSGPSVYNSSSVSQYSTANIIRGCTSTSNPILQFKVNITGGLCTPNDVITRFVFSTAGDAGSTNPTADITKAEVYYTDTAQGFSNLNFFGSANAPNGTFTITGSQALDLGGGPYYFYLAYTVPTSTVTGTTVDASMNSFTFNGTTYTNMTTPSPAGGRPVVTGTCPSAPDLAPPTSNTQTITKGSLIIPMDNTYQSIVGPFNLKAYGLVHQLLLNDIPVKWIIKSGKIKDSSDFSANVSRVYPTATTSVNAYFKASEFVVDSFYLDHSYYAGGLTATQVMTAFATPNNVAVYKLNADVAVDVRYTLNHRPKIAVFSNGGYDSVQTRMLTVAGITSNVFVQNAGDFTGLAECYTFCSEAHWAYANNPDTRPVQRVVDFVNEGGNFLAQCAGIDLYENHQPLGGHFQTTNGVTFSANTANKDYSPDMAYCQYQGTVTPEPGVIASYWPSPGSTYKAETYIGVSPVASTSTVVASGVHIADPDSIGSNVFYLGGHSYNTAGIGNENGVRMYLNATLVPARRPTAFPISLPANPTICAGQTVSIAPSCVSSATYAWSPSTGLSSATVCNPVASPTATTVYSVVGFNGGCIMGPSTITVSVNPTPVMTSTNSAAMCGNGTVNIPLTSNLTSTYQWIATDNPNTTGESITTQTTSTLNNTIINNTTSVQTIVYTVTPTSTLGSCAGTPQVVTVTVSPAPTMSSANTATICANATVNIPLTANIAGSTFTWIATDNVNTTGESLTTQTTATLSNTITNSTISSQNVIYTITPTAGGCLGTAQTATVTVNPTPVMTSTTTATLCSGGTVSIPLTSNIGATYTWIAADNLNTTGESLTTQSTATLNNSITNSSASSQDVIYTVTPTAGGCPGTAQTVTVTVNPTPLVTSAGTATICTGATVNITLTSNVVGATFTWIATDNTNTTGESLTTQSTNTLSNTIINGTTSAQNVIYTVTPFAGACPGTATTVTVTVNPTPAMTSANTATICSAGTVSIPLTSNVASNYTWIATDNINTTGESLTTQSTATLSNTITNSSTSVQNVIYTVTPTSAGGSCAGTAQTVTVTVNPTPAMTSASTATICSGGTASITLTSNIASTYTWIATDNVNTTGESLTTQSTNTLSNTITNNSASVQNVIYTVTPTAGGCPGTMQTVTVTVNPTPAMTSASTSTICSGSTVSIPFTSNVASTYTWIATDNVNTTGESLTTQSTNTLSNTITNSSTSVQTVIYTVTPTSTGGSCAGTAQTVTITVNPTPAMTSTSTATICSGGAVSIPFTSNVASTYTWIATDNVNTTGESLTTQSTNTLNNTITNGSGNAQNVIYTVTPTSTTGSCAGVAQTITITVNPTPAMTSTSTSTICTGNTVNITLTSTVAGSTFTWIATDNVNTTGESLTTQSTATLSNTITNGTTSAQNVIYTVTPTFGGCTGAGQTVTVTINPTPAMTSANTSTICSGGTVSIPFTSNVASTYTWIATDNVNTTGESLTTQSTNTLSNTIVNNSTSVQAVIYTVTPTSTGGSCAGVAQTVTITVNPKPAMTSASTATICSGASVSIPFTSNVASTYTWIATDNINTVGESLTTQSTATLNNTITSSSTIAQNIIYTVTPTSTGGSCVGAAQTVTVTVNPGPAMTSASSATICTGATVSIPFTSNVASTYTWIATDNVNTTGESLTTQSTATLSNTITNSTTSAQNVIYTVTPTSTGGSCTGASQTVTVQVNPVPTATATPAAQAICSGNVASMNLTSNIVGTTYSWITTQSGVTGASNSSGSTITQTLTTTGASQGTVTYTITPVNGCTGSSIVATVTVNPIPVAPTASSNSPVCISNTITFSVVAVAGATYSWTGPNSYTSNIQNPSITNAALTDAGTYSVNVTVNGCTGPNKTTTVVVNPPPPSTLTATANSPLCTGQTLALSTPSVTSASYSWSGPNTFTSSAQNPSISNVTLAANGTYTITATVPGCGLSGTGTVNVVVNPTPVAPIAGNNGPLCVGATLTFTASSTGTTYSWIGPNTFTSNIQNPSITNITSTGAGVYSVTATSLGCTSVAGTTNVIVNPIPATPTVSSNSPLCVNQTLNLNTSAVGGASYSWNGPNSYTSTTQNTSISNVAIINAGTYSLAVTVNGCTSATGTVNVVINSTPVTPTATVNNPVCVGDTLFLSASSTGGATYSWTGPNTFTANTQNPTITAVTAAANGTYTVIANNGCASAPATVTVAVSPTPAAPVAGSNSPLCTGSTLNLTASNTGATYNWSGPNTFTSSVRNPNITNVTSVAAGIYTVTAASAVGCVSPTATVNVVINSPAVVSAAGGQTVCANNANTTLNGLSSTGAGQWSSSGTGTFTPNNTTLNAIYHPSATEISAGTTTLTLASLNNGACAAVTDQMVITITPSPTVSAGGSQTVCANNSQVTLNGTFGVASGISWSSSGSGTFNPDNITPSTTYSPSATDITAGTVTLTITTTGNGNCLAATNTMVVTIKPAPVVNGGADIFVCSNNANAVLNGTSNTGGGQWSSSGTGTFTPNNTTLNATYISSASDISGGLVTLTLTSTNNVNCLAVSDTLTVKYTAPPTVSAGLSTSVVCANNSAVALNGTSSTGAGAWTTSGTGTFTPNNTTLNATYNASAADGSAGTVTFTLATTNNGGCIPVTSQVTLTITPSPTAEAGTNQSVCGNNANVTLTGSVTIASGGTWSSTGTGTFSPNNTSMTTTYIPSNADTTAGSVKIILTTTGNGNCNATKDTMIVTITHAPSISAGANANVCLSSPNYVLNGYSSTGSATWSTLGTGTFTPNNATLNATYLPSTADTTAKAVMLILTSANNNGCNVVTDTMKIVYTNIPTVSTSGNQTVCGNNANVALSSSSSTGTGAWTSSGTGTFTPNNTALNGTYIPSSADTASGIITLTVTSTGGCSAVTQTISVTITNAPGANANTDVAVCANNATVTLNGSVSGATSTGIWSTSGTGTFTPNNSTLNATYIPSNSDTTVGSVTMILTSTGNGNCKAATDTMKITYTHAPHTTVGSDATVCANNAVALSGSVSGGTGNGVWTTTNGGGTFTPNNTTLNASYNTVSADTVPTSVMLILTSTNNGGCLASSDTMMIKVKPNPIVYAGADQTMCANNVSIVLSGTVTVATGGQWSSLSSGTFTPNNSTLNASYNPSAAEISSGIVTFILTSTGNGLCQAVTDTMKVHFTPAPTVNAGADIFICNSSTTTNLNGSVSGGTTTGQWTTLGSGTFTPNNSTLNAAYNLSTADTTAGKVKLVLTSTNNLTCNAVTDTVVIKLNSAPNVFAGNDTTVCGNTNAITLNGSISGNIIGHWATHGNGAFTPNDSALHGTYTPGANDVSAGLVILTLTSNVNGQCPSSSDSVKITFSPATIVNAGANIPVCNGVMTAQLNGTVNGGTTSGHWTTLGTGTFTPNDSTLNATYNLSTADTTAGSVQLVLTSTHNGGCSVVSDTMTISIHSIAITKAGNDTSLCGNSVAVQLHGSVTGGSSTGQWTSAGTGTFTPNDSTLNANYLPSAGDVTAGNVMLTLTSTHNCINKKDSLKLTIVPAPVVNAGTNIVICNGTMSAALSGTVTGGASTGTWSTLGSGTFTPNDSTLNATYNLSVADTTVGKVTLILASTHNGSCSVVRDTVLITRNPTTITSAGHDTTVCSGISSVQLHGAVNGGSPTGVWSSAGTGTFTPSNTTLNAGYQPSASDIANGSVKLVLISTGNCVNTNDTMKITFAPTATVNAGSNQTICSSNAIALSGSVTATSIGHWSTIGTGTYTPNDSTLNATYTPAATDNDTLTFILAVNQGGSCGIVRDTMIVYRNGQPHASFLVNNACLGQSVSFTDNSTTNVGGINIWHWNFGAGDTTSIQNPTYTYTTSGTHTVQLLVSVGVNCKDSISKIVNIHPVPVPAFTLSANCMSDSAVFTNSSTISQGNIASWLWNFGDGHNASTQNPHHLYDSIATYTVNLTTVSDSGCSASITHTLTLHPSPLAGFVAQSNCLKLMVNFKDTSKVILPDTISSYNWSFGDGGASAMANPSHAYSASGTYTVLLQVQNSNFCKDTATKVITTGQPVVAQYIPDGGSYNVHQDIDFTSQVTGASTYNWSFGDNSTASTLPNPIHGFNLAGTYTVTLIATNSLGCSDTVRHTFEVNPSGHNVPTGFTPNGDGLNDYFYIMGGPFSQYDLRVFNEWGQQIFMSNNQSDKWDGTYNGTKQPAGTYMYIFNATVDGKSLKLSGEINLIQ
jgi:gliding motility-associated-like protein